MKVFLYALTVADEGAVPLKPGDCVVWVTDSGQDRGVVRWLKLGEDGQLKVGVYLVRSL